jgi:hypothetical protein
MLTEPTNPGMMKRLRPEEKAILRAQRNLPAYEANLELAIAEGDEEKAARYREAIAQALVKTGEFEQAMKLNPSPLARATKEAVGRNDKWRCKCPNPVIEVETGLRNAPPRQVVTSKWVAKDRVWSKKHGKTVTLWECSLCGFQNAIDGYPDELSAELDKARLDNQQEGQGPDHQVLKAI